MDDDLWRYGDGELLAALDAVEVESRHLYRRMIAVVAEIDTRGVSGRVGNCTTQQLLRSRLRCSAGEAAGRVQAARELVPSRSPSGETAAPALPATREAVAAAEIGVEQVRVIGAALRNLPASVDAPTRAAAEQRLVERACVFDATVLRKIARHLRGVLDPDGKPPAEDDAPLRQLDLFPDGRGGMLGRLRLDAEGAAILKTALEPLAKPRPETAEGKDRRTASTRSGDALVELAARALDDGGLPSQGGERPHIGIVLDYERLKAACGAVTLDTGDEVSIEMLRRIACDARIYPVVLGAASEPLDVGRATRIVPSHLRRALVARDRGCAFPACELPARWCDAHHVVHWCDGGQTALANLVLLCRRHHRLLHHSDWEVEILGGRAQFVPPDWIDPTRAPVVNHVHHLDDDLSKAR